ncbi:hypothetical protein E6W36_14590 [Hankyongella ginsenosidimutans]|uniref:Uncharacterized protein n=1 Tax=Hankyongella ginsenosidimutans TaxID=1763828 RepID=A0A4D7C3G6_9SPHN|nr:hypothetical protein [Hankyongella ginsenosidimutans]QCI80294.1 hypothetical protein E6W36_14590 [Hankyongella ginsenosidimutans]
MTVTNGGGYWRVWLARRLGDVPSRDALSLADDAPRLYLDQASATQRAVQRISRCCCPAPTVRSASSRRRTRLRRQRSYTTCCLRRTSARRCA